MNLQHHLKNYGTVLIGAGMARFLVFTSSLITARVLGKSIYGQFSLFYVAFSLVPLFPQAFDTTFIRYARNLGAGETREEYLRINIVLKLLYFLLILIAALPYLIITGDAAWQGRTATGLYLLGALGGGAVCLCYTLAAYYQEQERFAESTLMELSHGALICAGLAYSWFTGYLTELKMVLGVYIAAASITGTISLVLLLRLTGAIHHFRKDQALIFFNLGKWVFLTSIFMFLFPRLDVMLLANYLSYADIGIYAAGGTLVMIVSLFSRSLNKVVLPKAMKEALRSRAAFRAFSREVLISLTPALTLTLGLFAFADPVFKLVYGTEYTASATIFRVLVIGYLASMVYLPYSFIFYALAEARFRFCLEVSKAALAFILLLVLIPKAGALGAAAAISISMTANAAVSYLILKRKIASHFAEQAEGGIIGGPPLASGFSKRF